MRCVCIQLYDTPLFLHVLLIPYSAPVIVLFLVPCKSVLFSCCTCYCHSAFDFLLLTTLPLPVLDLGKGPLQWWEQTPRLHGSTQHSKAHQQHPAQRQHNSKGNPVCLDRVCDSKVSRHVLGQECQRQEQDGCFADEQRHPRKAIYSGRLRHGHQLEVLFDMSAKESIWGST